MRFASHVLLVLAAAGIVDSFALAPTKAKHGIAVHGGNHDGKRRKRAALSPGRRAVSTTTAAATVDEDECGCDSPPSTVETSYSGKPSEKALAQKNPRDAIVGSSVLNLSGERISMGDILNEKGPEATSVVVFLRSLG